MSFKSIAVSSDDKSRFRILLISAFNLTRWHKSSIKYITIARKAFLAYKISHVPFHQTFKFSLFWLANFQAHG